MAGKRIDPHPPGIIMQHQEHHFMFMDFCEDTHCLLEDDSPTEMMMMKKEQKDAELDKKIEALRKKNEALMKRYQEVEEDKKRAEQEGMSLRSRKGKTDDLTISINKSSNDQRVVTERSGPGGLRDREKEKSPGSSVFSIGRGKRRQLLVTASGNITEKRVFGERKDRNRPVSPARMKSCAEEELKSNNTRGRQRVPQDDADRWSRCEDLSVVPVTQAVADLNLVSSQEEQLEYLRWKKEREEIDRERVARHKTAEGQWRRAWDMEKTHLMFSEEEPGGTSDRGGRNARRGNMRAEASTGGQQASDRKRKCVPVVRSKAQGKERLTGRARRWDAKEQEEHLQVHPESSLQEFLEELDALCAPEVENVHPETDDENTKPRACEEVKTPDGTAEQNEHVSTESTLKGIEKRVRFSENHVKNGTETTSQVKNGRVEDDRQTLARDDGERVPEEIKLEEPDKNQHSKSCSNRGNEELMDSSLSVLELDAGSLPVHGSSADVARENGKVV
ncbi:coiled-coil domain-containing protein 9B-like isoform X3 [Carassius auratus]|uniref:Coiled-coil domain-containing protein 9B-like isoform X3 n=1 Tax=Carassius auratus TaxID=7957 RepID=A0A6P6R9U5_CARAU|nr:coiled-coil domain-containing protein 9B-like isoform X3 [Carassius auratus]